MFRAGVPVQCTPKVDPKPEAMLDEKPEEAVELDMLGPGLAATTWSEHQDGNVTRYTRFEAVW